MRCTKLLISLLFPAVLLTFSHSAFALGKTGHRVTGALAELYLSPQTAAEIQKLIGNKSLAEISTYVDFMRSHPDKFWKNTSLPYHYVTVPDGKQYFEVGAPEKGDAVTALAHYSNVIVNAHSTREEKVLALQFIVHIIGDLHQPLHVGNGMDHGGNRVKVEYFRKKTNLHSVWDSQMIDNQKLSYSEWTKWLSNDIDCASIESWKSVNVLDWIEESRVIRGAIYPKSERLSWSYEYEHLPTLKVRMSQAGVRIAFYLNTLFAPKHAYQCKEN